jgi:hypothetical protein
MHNDSIPNAVTLTVLLEVYFKGTACCLDPRSQTFGDALNWLVSQGFITVGAPDSDHLEAQVTQRGKVFIEYILELPLPSLISTYRMPGQVSE